MTQQNLVDVHFDAAQWAAVDEALLQLERVWSPMLVLLGPVGRRRVVKMGDGSEAFCRGAHRLGRDNSALIPSSIDLDEMARDLVSHDELASRHARLAKLLEKVVDTDVALGSDAMTAALQCYAQLKLAGRASGLDPLRRDLGRRFDKSARRRPEADVAA